MQRLHRYFGNHTLISPRHNRSNRPIAYATESHEDVRKNKICSARNGATAALNLQSIRFCRKHRLLDTHSGIIHKVLITIELLLHTNLMPHSRNTIPATASFLGINMQTIFTMSCDHDTTEHTPSILAGMC